MTYSVTLRTLHKPPTSLLHSLKVRADLKGSSDNMWTVLTWSWHSIHSFSIRILLRKVIYSVRVSTTTAKSSSLLIRKSYTVLRSSEYLQSLTWSPGTEWCLLCLYFYFLYKTINNHLKPTHLSNTHTPVKLMDTMANTRWKNTNNCNSLSTYLPDSASGNFEQFAA